MMIILGVVIAVVIILVVGQSPLIVFLLSCNMYVC